MRKLAHILRFVAFTGLLALSTSVSGQVFKCVDETTGKVTFTDRACPDKGVGDYVPVGSANVDSGYTSGREVGQNRRERAAPQAQERANATYCPSGTRNIIGGHFVCSVPLKSIRDRDLLIEQLVNQPPSHPMPMPQSPPIIVNSDPAGAWDTNGNRYNKGAGNTYFRADGKTCQLLNTGMQCN